MLPATLFIVLFTFTKGYCDWISEWMDPVQAELSLEKGKPKANNDYRIIDTEESKLPLSQDYEEAPAADLINPNTNYKLDEEGFSFNLMKSNLEKTLEDAKALVAVLKTHIDAVTAREKMLKDAIINGRSGVTALTVSTQGHTPSAYIIRDGRWWLCNGIIHFPNDRSSGDFGAIPRCIGQEILTSKDPCAFNSIIKYETIPTRRSPEYYEDDFYCLKTSFNTTMEQYLSVTRSVVNSTCNNGIVRSLEENIRQCGIRMLSEYSYFPQEDSSSSLPMEYCTGASGACDLIVAWHITNASLENFEFLKREPQFKTFFIAGASVNKLPSSIE